MLESFIEKYAREFNFPTIWCSGCGLGTFMRVMMKAFDAISLDPNKLVLVSGIGCSSRVTAYTDCNTVHTTHGRALPVATGIKLVNPSLTVVVITGDGDGTAIGGNHLIHAARRNIDLTCILLNNSCYGMTSGQVSPMTPHSAYSSTSPYGNIEHSFDLVGMLKSAGATYIARGTVYHYPLAEKLIVSAIEHKGFSFVEILFQCPTYFGRFNKVPEPADMLREFKENGVKYVPGKDKPLAENQFYIGELYRDESKVEYVELLKKHRHERLNLMKLQGQYDGCKTKNRTL